MATDELATPRPLAEPSGSRRFATADLVERFRLPTLVVLLVGIVVWSLLSRQFGEYLFPSPGRVLRGLVDVIRGGELWVHVWA
jgi:ABC-type nitrate/sulfonate/bicarbonate transport system permease component